MHIVDLGSFVLESAKTFVQMHSQTSIVLSSLPPDGPSAAKQVLHAAEVEQDWVKLTKSFYLCIRIGFVDDFAWDCVTAALLADLSTLIEHAKVGEVCVE